MSIEPSDLLNLLPGAKAIVSGCEGGSHSPESAGCLCALKGKVITIGKRYDTAFAGTSTWWINNNKRARLSELTLVCEES